MLKKYFPTLDLEWNLPGTAGGLGTQPGRGAETAGDCVRRGRYPRNSVIAATIAAAFPAHVFSAGTQLQAHPVYHLQGGAREDCFMLPVPDGREFEDLPHLRPVRCLAAR